MERPPSVTSQPGWAPELGVPLLHETFSTLIPEFISSDIHFLLIRVKGKVMSEGATRASSGRELGLDNGAGALVLGILGEECRGVDRSGEGVWCC